jgi:endo-alpha-1,4-polygalactosaminidase (GH114 family)
MVSSVLLAFAAKVHQSRPSLAVLTDAANPVFKGRGQGLTLQLGFAVVQNDR